MYSICNGAVVGEDGYTILQIAQLPPAGGDKTCSQAEDLELDFYKRIYKRRGLQGMCSQRTSTLFIVPNGTLC